MFSGDGLHFMWHRVFFTEESCTGMAVPVQQRLELRQYICTKTQSFGGSWNCQREGYIADFIARTG